MRSNPLARKKFARARAAAFQRLRRPGSRWPAQDVDARDIEQIEDRAEGRAEVHIVDVEAHAGLEGVFEVRLPDAPDRDERQLAEARSRRLDVDVRGDARDLRDILEPVLLDLLPGDGRDRDGGRLQVLRAEPRGDDALLKTAMIAAAETASSLDTAARRT